MKDTRPIQDTNIQFLFQESFNKLEDPRRTTKGNFYYPLDEIFFLAISAIVSGVTSWLSISTFGEEKLPWLRTFSPYKNGIPSHDTLSKVFAKLDPVKFSECFTHWVYTMTDFLGGEVVAIDGKTIRGSGNTNTGTPAIHVVSAFVAGNRICLGQTSVHDKENEILVIPELLDLYHLRLIMGYKWFCINFISC